MFTIFNRCRDGICLNLVRIFDYYCYFRVAVRCIDLIILFSPRRWVGLLHYMDQFSTNIVFLNDLVLMIRAQSKNSVRIHFSEILKPKNLAIEMFHTIIKAHYISARLKPKCLCFYFQ